MPKYTICKKHDKPIKYDPEQTPDHKCPKCEWNKRFKDVHMTQSTAGKIAF